MKLMMAKNAKLMSMLGTNISGKGDEAGSKSPGSDKVKRQKRICGHYKKDGYCGDKGCFSLPENKDKHLDWYKE